MSKFYEPTRDSQWHEIDPDNLIVACCDCGLVHRYQFKIVGKRLFRLARRDNIETMKVRVARRQRRRP